MTQAWPLYVVTLANCFLAEKEGKKRVGKKNAGLQKLCIWKVQNELLISQQALEPHWEELCNAVGSL